MNLTNQWVGWNLQPEADMFQSQTAAGESDARYPTRAQTATQTTKSAISLHKQNKNKNNVEDYLFKRSSLENFRITSTQQATFCSNSSIWWSFDWKQ